MPDLPPSICAARIASHLANAGAAPGMGSYTRLTVADQALREVYAMGFRLVRTTVLDDMDRERDDLLDELARVTAQRDRLLEEQVGRTVTGTRPGSLADRLRHTRQDANRASRVGVTDDEIEDLGRQAREVGQNRAGSIGTEPEEWPRV